MLLEAICLKAMARDAAERYAMVNELATALDDYLRDKWPSDGAKPGGPPVPGSGAATVDTTSTITAKPARSRTRALAALIAVGGGALVLLSPLYLLDELEGLARQVVKTAEKLAHIAAAKPAAAPAPAPVTPHPAQPNPEAPPAKGMSPSSGPSPPERLEVPDKPAVIVETKPEPVPLSTAQPDPVIFPTGRLSPPERVDGEDPAIARLTARIQQNPKDIAAYNERGNAYFDRGKASSDKGPIDRATDDYDRAIADYTEVIRLAPQVARAYFNRGIPLLEKGQLSHAIADFSEAIRLDPTDADFFRNRGKAYIDPREYDKAVRDYDDAIRLTPDDPSLYDGRGRAYAEKGALVQSRADYDQADRLRSRSGSPQPER